MRDLNIITFDRMLMPSWEDAKAAGAVPKEVIRKEKYHRRYEFKGRSLKKGRRR